MNADTRSLEHAETEARAALQAELSHHLELTQDVINLIGDSLALAPELKVVEVPASRKVATNLLIRISNDIRSACILAVSGYPVQSLALVACIYEGAFTVAFISCDDDLAREWINYCDPARPFRDAKTLTQEGLQKLRHPQADTQAIIEYKIYRQLCWAKHNNPILQKEYGYEIDAGNVIWKNGPIISEPAVRASWYSLENAAHFGLLAATSFCVSHVPQKEQRDLMQRIKAVGKTWKTLLDAARQKWGNEDPFPGQW